MRLGVLSDGTEAKAMIASLKDRVDVLVTDVVMPNLPVAMACPHVVPLTAHREFEARQPVDA